MLASESAQIARKRRKGNRYCVIPMQEPPLTAQLHALKKVKMRQTTLDHPN
jgi:hypothetical protein